MNKEPFNPKSRSTRRHDAGTHPVLARLPDVADEPLAPQRSARAAAAGFVDYRFDMPAGTKEAEPRSRRRLPPPAFKRSPENDRRSRPVGGASRALPESDPFAIGGTSMVERLAPVARFLTLFLLFTAIGTFVLSTTRERSNPPKSEEIPSATAPRGMEQKLEPTHKLEPASNTDHPTIATPKAFGPLGANSGTSATPSTPIVTLEPQSAADDPASHSADTPLLAGANGEQLPQVQTTEITPAPHELDGGAAPARLTGNIQASDDSPTEKAKKPPAVARLPAIFDAPQNFYQ